MTIGWGGVSRVDLEPAGCDDPQCEADHGYTGVLASDDFSLRVSAAADGQDAVARLLSFAEALSARTHARVSFVAPAYGHRRSATSCRRSAGHSGARLPDRTAPTGLVLPEAPAYVVFLVDGLGARLLERYARRRAVPLLAAHRQRARHRRRAVDDRDQPHLARHRAAAGRARAGRVHQPGARHRQAAQRAVLGHPTSTRWSGSRTRPRSRGCRPGRVGHVVNKREFDRSGLTRAAHRGADFIGADQIGERIAAAVTATRDRPSLTYLYDGDLDWTGHRYGVDSRQWLQQLAIIDAEAEQLREALPDDVRLVVVADHGMVDSPPESRIDVDEHPELRDGVVLLGGEARFRHLYCHGGAVHDVAATWREVLGDRAEVLTREEAIERGWFGAVRARCCPASATWWSPAAATSRSSPARTSPTR